MYNNIGKPPGTLTYSGNIYNDTTIHVIDYNENDIQDKIIDVNELKEMQVPSGKRCIYITGLSNIETIRKIGEYYNIDNLFLEDILNTMLYPKIDFRDDYIFITVRSLSLDDNNDIVSYQLSFIMFDNLLIYFQEKELSLFNVLKTRFKDKQFRSNDIDYLLYVMIDIVIDHYFYISDKINEQLDELDDIIFDNTDNSIMQKIQAKHKELLTCKKAVVNLSSIISTILKTNNGLIHEPQKKYFKDIEDHISHIKESFENHRDHNSQLKDLYQSNVSNKMNTIMKTLTIISTIFIPITFLAGMYGTNFINLPEAKWKYGYYMLWLICLILAIFMLFIFKKKKWF